MLTTNSTGRDPAADGDTTTAAGKAATPAPAVSLPARYTEGPTCWHCESHRGDLAIGRFGHVFFRCAACGASTTIRLRCLPGHRPQLCQVGAEFHRECAQCGTREFYHRNPVHPPGAR